MCFRPSAVATSENSPMISTKCPSCGAPIFAKEGTDSGICPYCNESIPKSVDVNTNNNVKIL